MSNRIFLVRVSYLVPVLAADEAAAEEYITNADNSVFEDAMCVDQPPGDDLITVERELTTLDMEGTDSESWGDVIPFCADGENEGYSSIEEILDWKRRGDVDDFVEPELTTLTATEA